MTLWQNNISDTFRKASVLDLFSRPVSLSLSAAQHKTLFSQSINEKLPNESNTEGSGFPGGGKGKREKWGKVCHKRWYHYGWIYFDHTNLYPDEEMRKVDEHSKRKCSSAFFTIQNVILPIDIISHLIFVCHSRTFFAILVIFRERKTLCVHRDYNIFSPSPSLLVHR